MKEITKAGILQLLHHIELYLVNNSTHNNSKRDNSAKKRHYIIRIKNSSRAHKSKDYHSGIKVGVIHMSKGTPIQNY
jgi:hypothetical protein